MIKSKGSKSTSDPTKNIRGSNVDFDKMKEIRFLTNGCSLPKVEYVPIRKVGITGSGRLLDCRSNVSKIVNTYGGSEISGYDISTEGDCILLNPHSIWKTPEGKLVDITLSSLKEDTISFIPIVENNPTKNYYFSTVQLYISTTGLFIDGINQVKLNFQNGNNLYFSKAEIKKGQLDLKQMWVLRSETFLNTFPERLSKDFVSFAEPSTRTGKYFEMRYLPNNTETSFVKYVR